MNLAITKTRHKEYLLILPIISLIILFFNQSPTSLSLSIIINIMSLIAILASAFSVVRHADVLAHRFGEPYGSLILSLSVVILEVGLISALMATGESEPQLMRDTLYSIIMIVMTGLVGFSLLLGGYKFATQYVNLNGIKQYLIAIIPLAVLTLVFPSSVEDKGISITQLSIVLACISALTYFVFLIIQTKTHKQLFVYEYEDDSDDGDPSHGKPSNHSNLHHAIWLIIHLAAVIFVTKLNANNLDYLLATANAPKQFTGFLIALLILSPEGLGAIKAVLLNQVQRAMNIFFGSILATISLTVPAVVTISIITNNEIVFGLDLPQIIILTTTLVLCHISFSSGKTNILNGASLLTIFIGYILTIIH